MSNDILTPSHNPRLRVVVSVFLLIVTTIGIFVYVLNTLHQNAIDKDGVVPSKTRKVSAGTLPSGWTIQKETGTETAYFAVDCASVNECWVVGGPYFMDGIGIILHTIDAGQTWTDITPQNTLGFVYGIDFKPPNTIGVVGRYGKMLISHDRGVTWTNVTLYNERGIEDTPLYKLSWNGDTDVWATANTHIYHSTDNGQNWNNYHTAEQTVPFGIGCSDLSVCIAGGTGAKAYRTTDRGATWTRSEPPNYWYHLLDVYVSSTGKTYMSGGDDQNETPTYGTGGVIFSSSNTGQSWTPLTIPQSGDIPSVKCISDTDCMALSADTGTILKTSDGGTTWIQEELGFQNRMLSIAYIDTDHAMAVGRGIVLRYSVGSTASSPTPTPTIIPAGSGTPTSSPTSTPTSTVIPPGSTSTATPTATVTTIPDETSSPTPSRTPSPTPTLTPTLTHSPTPSSTLTPSPTPTETPTDTPIPTNTEVPTSTIPPVPTSTPILAAFCDGSCGICGWRDRASMCHPDGKLDGSGSHCCYNACVHGSCKLISGYGEGNACKLDNECAIDRVVAQPQTDKSPTFTPHRRSTITAPVSGDDSWAIYILLPLALILGAIVL